MRGIGGVLEGLIESPSALVGVAVEHMCVRFLASCHSQQPRCQLVGVLQCGACEGVSARLGLPASLAMLLLRIRT